MNWFTYAHQYQENLIIGLSLKFIHNGCLTILKNFNGLNKGLPIDLVNGAIVARTLVQVLHPMVK